MSGNGDYIPREAAIKKLDHFLSHLHTVEGTCAIGVAKTLIEKIPAADVRPVVKATWKRIDYKPCGHDYECSSCGWKNDMETHFCPNCGAKMEES